MISKEWHRDRIKALEMERLTYYDQQKLIIHIFIGIGAIYMAMLSIYIRDVSKYLYQIVYGSYLVVSLIIILLVFNFYAKKKEKCYL